MLDVAYRHGRQRVIELVTGLDDRQLRTPVPATPKWTVHELLAHLVGGAVDAANGRVDGAPGEQWTARHVAERRSASLDTLLAEWDRVGATIEAGLAGQRFTGPNIAADLICHEADLHETFGWGRVDRAHWHHPFLEVMMLFLGQRLQSVASVVVHDECGHQWHCGSGGPITALHADGYELLRAMFSRRSRRQIAAWDWTPAPTAHIVNNFGYFGPRDDDQPIPRSA
jgi:uncharacterized protein (TIGR03083 family)